MHVVVKEVDVVVKEVHVVVKEVNVVVKEVHVVVKEVRNHRVANHGTANEVSLPSVHAVPHRQTLHAATDLPVVAAAVAHSLHPGGQMRTNETETGAVVVPEESRYKTRKQKQLSSQIPILTPGLQWL